MNDDRVRRILEVAEQPLAPAPEFATALLDDLRAELGFEGRSRAAGGAAAGTAIVRGRVAPDGRRGRLGLLLVAAIVVSATLGVLSLAAQQQERVRPPSADALAAIRAAGRIRIAIRPDHPQFSIAGQPASGFDKDVAEALAAELGLAPEIIVIDADELLAGRGAAWDVALPSVATRRIDPGAFEISDPYYAWLRRLLVPEASPAANVAGLRDRTICAVAGDAGEDWLRGTTGTAATPITSSVVTRDSDDACLAALASGEVAAMVTATMSDADIDVRSGIRVLDGPPAEPRAAIVPRRAGAPGTSTLVQALDAAIAALREDGTLTELSQRRFGGQDLTVP